MEASRDARAGAGDRGRLWLRTWLVALVLVGIAFGGWEALWRVRGFRPSVTDDALLWAVTRDRASNDDPETVVLVGSSRLLHAIDPETFAAATGWKRPLQLAIAMGPSLPILQDLARDPRFRGTVVCEIHPGIAFNRTRTRALRNVASSHLYTHHALSPADRLEKRLAVEVQERLVSRLPALAPARVLSAWRAGKGPRPSYLTLSGDRFASGDAALVRFQLARTRALEAAPPGLAMRAHRPEAIPELAAEFGRAAREVRERGGRVVFVRLPSSGAQREEEREQTPRERYWDVFRQGVASPSVHFEDHPRLAAFRTPDGAHVDVRQIRAFSRVLGEVVAAEIERSGP